MSPSRSLIREAVKFLATGVYCGYFPIAPASFGSLVFLLVFWFAFPFVADIHLPVIIAMVILSAIVSSLGEKHFGKDGKKIVIDEFAGMAITLYGVQRSFFPYLLSFFLFRIFDIAKPFPVRKAEDLPGGLGVTADDVVAGLYANLVVRAILLI